MELCKWTVDLGVLPSFQQNAGMPQPNGFYTGTFQPVSFPLFLTTHASLPATEFELGLELDSAEVRGILIYQGQDWGRVVFDFRA